MNPWPFVGAAFALTLAVTAALVLWSWAAMHAAERDGEE